MLEDLAAPLIYPLQWLEANAVYYSIVETHHGFIAVVLNVDTGTVIYKGDLLFETEQEAEDDLLAALREDVDEEIEAEGPIEGELDEDTAFVRLAPTTMFERVITLGSLRQVKEQLAESDTDGDET
jgi:hypothetical protein